MSHLRAMLFVPVLVVGALRNWIKPQPFDAEAELRRRYPELYVTFWTDGTE